LKAAIIFQAIFMKQIPKPAIDNFYAIAFTPLLTAFTVENESSFDAILEKIDMCTDVQEIFLHLSSYVSIQRAHMLLMPTYRRKYQEH